MDPVRYTHGDLGKPERFGRIDRPRRSGTPLPSGNASDVRPPARLSTLVSFSPGSIV